MSSCQCQEIDAKFDRPYVAGKLDDYRRSGPRRTTRMLVHDLAAGRIEDASLLDIGGGFGPVIHAMMDQGVRTATNVEASSAYLDACVDECRRRGYAHRVRHLHGDYVELFEEAGEADVVVLDRVICCYDDMAALVRHAAVSARRLFGAVYPRDVWWVRLTVPLYYNLRHHVSGSAFRVFVHPTSEVEAILRDAGLMRRSVRNVWGWQVAVFER